MKQINTHEQRKIVGGISIWGIISIIASVFFGIGAFDGFIKPRGCEK